MLTKNSYNCFANLMILDHYSSSRLFTILKLLITILNRIRILYSSMYVQVHSSSVISIN